MFGPDESLGPTRREYHLFEFTGEYRTEELDACLLQAGGIPLRFFKQRVRV